MDKRHNFTIRNINEIPVFVQSNELKKQNAAKYTIFEFYLYCIQPWKLVSSPIVLPTFKFVFSLQKKRFIFKQSL